MKIVIIGCPRSGFRFISRVFSEAGFILGHESWMKCGSANWMLTSKPMPADGLVLHQIRHPLDVIGSMQTITNGSWDLLMKHTSARKKHDLIERGMRAYLEWNQIAEAKAVYSYRVEDIDTAWSTITDIADMGDVSLSDIRRDLNSRKKKYQRPMWSDLADRDLTLSVEIAKYYRTLGGHDDS